MERTGSRRLGASRYKSGRPQISIHDLTIADDSPRHGAYVQETANKPPPAPNKGTTNEKENAETDPDSELDDNENGVHRKRRVPSSSAPPSVQIAILVIGAVLGCVLLTGFIRWRVRARLEARKSKKLADDFVIYRGRMSYPGESAMDTIYECECEEGQNIPHSHATPGPEALNDEDEPTFDEIYCSHRFDRPLMSHSSYRTGHHARLLHPESPKWGRDPKPIRGARRHSTTRVKHGHKNRYYKHQRKRLENMYIQKLETIPMENSTPTPEDGEHANFATPLLQHAHSDHNGHSPNDQQTTPTSSGSPPLLRRSSPPPSRGVLASLLNTWRSLSFNRDWVGKMWQEQHNIRRISDLIRRLAGSRDSVNERSRPDSPATDTDTSSNTDVESNRLSVVTEVNISTLEQASEDTGQENNTHVNNNEVHSGEEVHVVDVLDDDETTENVEHCGLSTMSSSGSSNGQHSVNASETTSTCSSTPTSCSQSSEPGNCHSYWSFSVDNREPLKYESLLHGASSSTYSLFRTDTESPRYRKMYRARRWEDRTSAVRGIVAGDRNLKSTSISTRDHGERSPLTRVHRLHSRSVVETDESHLHSSTEPSQQSHLGHIEATNRDSSVRALATAAPSVQQEDAVTEQHSDVARTVDLPPAAVATIHTNTPAPYQQ